MAGLKQRVSGQEAGWSPPGDQPLTAQLAPSHVTIIHSERFIPSVPAVCFHVDFQRKGKEKMM